MAKAIWKDAVLADSQRTVEVGGNLYFPSTDICWKHLPSATTSVCHWKGTAHYFDITVAGALNPNAAWTYPDPKPEAAHIKDHVAFWRGVRVEP